MFEVASSGQGRSSHRPFVVAGSIVGTCLLIATTLCSLTIGARWIPLHSLVEAFITSDHATVIQIILYQNRLPRTLLGLLCGAAFGVSGALIQAATRNPLADPGIIGINAGAGFCITVATSVFGFYSIHSYIWFSLLGAATTTFLVYFFGMRRSTPSMAQLILAGVAVSALLGGISFIIRLNDPITFNAMRHWSLGSLAARDMSIVLAIVPFIIAGLIIATFVARSLNALSLGDDLAHALGSKVIKTQLLVIISVALLAGAGTAAVGPIGFIGLMVPHIVRWIVGPDQRAIIFLTMLFSPVLLLISDILGRVILLPGELEAGILTAFMGAPVFILFAQRKKIGGL